MAFTLYSLLQAALLCVNAIAVLHEERFLKNIENLGSECSAKEGGAWLLWSIADWSAGEQTRELADSERSQELNLS